MGASPLVLSRMYGCACCGQGLNNLGNVRPNQFALPQLQLLAALCTISRRNCTVIDGHRAFVTMVRTLQRSLATRPMHGVSVG